MSLQANQASKIGDEKDPQAPKIALIGFESGPVSIELDEWDNANPLFTHQCSHLTH